MIHGTWLELLDGSQSQGKFLPSPGTQGPRSLSTQIANVSPAFSRHLLAQVDLVK